MTSSEASSKTIQGFRFPVSSVSRSAQDTVAYAGTVIGASINVGDPAIIMPSGVRSSIQSISAPNGPADVAAVGAEVSVTLADDVSVQDGDLICHGDHEMIITDQIQAQIVWESDDSMLPGRQFLMKVANQSATVWVSELKYTLNMETMEHVAAKTLVQHDIGV